MASPDNPAYPRLAVGAAALAGYVGAIVLANWAISRFGFIWGPFGVVPAGTYFAGAVFVFRDVIQLTFGRWWVLPAIAAGALLSWRVSPSFAVASAVAFGCGELIDWAAFTPLIERGQVIAAFLLANTVGAAIDTLIFLQIAFGSTAHWQATTAAKVMVTLAFLPVRLIGRRTVNRWAVAA
jgi:hypothetical protein